MMSQCERLLQYLQEHNTIDPLEAWKILGIYRLSSRIYDLKSDGHRIETHKKKITNQFNEKTSVAQYKLVN